MACNKIISNFNIQRNDSIYIVAILLFTICISLIKINYYNIIGFNSDVPIYLSNSLYYAGMNYNGIFSVWWIYNSVTISFFTSLLFRMGFVNYTTICIVTSIFEIFGGVGLFIFLKNRFNSNLSLLGTIFYGSTSLFILNASSGMLDTSAVSISIWILIFAIISIDKNPKYFIVVSLLFVLGFFTRPTVGFVLPVIILYYFYKHNITKSLDDLLSNRDLLKQNILNYIKNDEFKYIVLSLFLCILSFSVIIILHNYFFNLPFDLFDRTISSADGFQYIKGKDIGYIPNYDYYVNRFFKYVAFEKVKLFGVKLSYILFYMTCFGLLITLFKEIKNFMQVGRKEENYATPHFKSILIVFLIIFLIIAILGFKFNHFITNISLMFVFTIIWSFIKKYDLNTNKYSFLLLNISFLVMNLIFISFISMKVHRYFLPVFVPLSYFFVLSVESILNLIEECLKKFNIFNRDTRKLFLKYLPLLIVLVLVCSTFISMSFLDEDKDNIKYSKIYEDTLNTTDYLMNLDEDYMDKNITVDHRDRFYNWFLQRNTSRVDNIYEPISLFDESDSDYIFLNESVKFENYTEIYHYGDSYLYERN